MPSTSSAEGDADLPRVPAPPGEILVLATVQGLVAERARVRAAFARVKPKAVALGVSPEMAAVLLRYERQEDEDPFEDLPDHDFVYSLKLREFGDVDLPPPDLVEAARLAEEGGVKVYGVDMPEEAYEDAFTSTVSTLGFLRYGRIQRRLAKRPPKANSAREFALKWDAAIRKVKGIRLVEAARERHMAQQARALAASVGGPVLLVVDLARAPGVLAALREA